MTMSCDHELPLELYCLTPTYFALAEGKLEVEKYLVINSLLLAACFTFGPTYDEAQQ